jgi:hypothetical protein
METKAQPLVCKSHSFEFIVIFIIGIVTGLSFSFLFFKQTQTSENSHIDETSTYQAGFDAAKKLVEQSSVGTVIKTPDDIRNFEGTVTATEGNRITIHKQFSTNPFDDMTLNDRAVIITNDTKITKLTAKDPAVFQTEMQEFLQNSINTTSAIPPGTFLSTSANIADITIGSQISVTATENIKVMKEFIVSEIQIQPDQPLII